MIERLIIDFFGEIEKNEFITKKHGKAVFFIQELLEKKCGKFNYIEKKKAIRLQEKYIEKKENVSVSTPDSFLKDTMAQYLGYENYENYKFSSPETPLTPPTPPTPPKLIWYKKYANEIFIFSSAVFILIFSSYIYQNNYAIDSNCIIWKGDHYEKSSCFNIKALNNNKHNINIERFERISTTDSTRFFINGKPIAWYGENKKGVKEYFTNRGFHPETRKELKLVSRAILYRDGKLNE